MKLHEIIERRDELMILSQPNEEQLLERVTLTIMLYNLGRESMADDDVYDMRVHLSSDLYLLVSTNYHPALDALVRSEIVMDHAESTETERLFEEFLEKKYSKSQSLEMTRKALKSSEKFLKAKKRYLDNKTVVNMIDKSMKHTQQVLNSMTKRSNT